MNRSFSGIRVASQASSWLAPCLLAIGFALFQCAKSAELANASENAMELIYISRFVSIATFAAVAAIFFKRVPAPHQVLAVAVPFMLVYFLASTIVSMLKMDTLGVTVVYATGILYGIASALYRLLFLYVFALFTPKVCSLLLAASHLASNLLLLSFNYLGPDLSFVMREVFVLTSTAVLMFVASRAESKQIDFGVSFAACQQSIADCGSLDSATDFAEKKQPEKASTTGTDQPSNAARHRETFPSDHLDWALLLASSFLISSLFGLTAQVNSSTGLDNFALYDTATSVILVVFNVLLLSFVAFRGERFLFSTVLLIVLALYATGFALYPATWNTNGPIADALIRGGFDCGSILLWILIARKAHARPQRSFFYFGLLFCALTVYPGRALGSLLTLNSAIGHAELIAGISVVSLWAICLLAVVAYVLSSSKTTARSERSSNACQEYRGYASVALTQAESPAAAGSNAFAQPKEDMGEDMGAASASEYSETALKAYDFGMRIEAFAQNAQLSHREKEVLVETLHGHSRASVAEKLYLSPGTVKTYLSRIYDKAGVSSKQELIDYLERTYLK